MRRKLRFLTSLLPVVVALCVAIPTIADAATLSLTTTYPSIIVNPGERASFSINVNNGLAVDQTVTLEIVEVPGDWESGFRGGGREIRAVHVSANDTSRVDFEVRVPNNTGAGTYPVRIRGRSGQATSDLTLSLIVSDQPRGVAELTAQYPQLEGPSGARFDFRVTLDNKTGQEQLFALAAQAPAGWQVTFKPVAEDKQISSLPVKGDSSERLDVRIQVPDHAPAGDYTIPVTATADGATASIDLKVVITGTYDLRLRPADDRFSFDATAGRETRVTLNVENAGTAPLTGISLSASTPLEWEVTFDPEEIDSIAAGESQEVTMTVKPRDRAIAGDYVVEVRASATQASDSAEFRVSLRTPTLWGWVGLVLVVGAVAGTFRVFRVYGRR